MEKVVSARRDLLGEDVRDQEVGGAWSSVAPLPLPTCPPLVLPTTVPDQPNPPLAASAHSVCWPPGLSPV